MKYNGTDYNEAWVLRSTLEEFVKHPVNNGKDKQHLEVVYNLIHANNKQYATGSTQN